MQSVKAGGQVRTLSCTLPHVDNDIIVAGDVKDMKIDTDEGTVTLSKVGIRVEGTAKLHMWGGGVGFIQMDAFDLVETAMVPSLNISLDISGDELEKKIKENLNDGGFGCESIDGALVYTYDLYERGFAIYVGEMIVGDISSDDVVQIECGGE